MKPRVVIVANPICIYTPYFHDQPLRANPTMALNWTMLGPDRIPVPLPGELMIMTVESGAEVSVTIPDVPPTSTSTSGGSGGGRNLNGIGKLFLTDQRVRPFRTLSTLQRAHVEHGLLAYFCLRERRRRHRPQYPNTTTAIHSINKV
jgi:hypothetical protein